MRWHIHCLTAGENINQKNRSVIPNATWSVIRIFGKLLQSNLVSPCEGSTPPIYVQCLIVYTRVTSKCLTCEGGLGNSYEGLARIFRGATFAPIHVVNYLAVSRLCILLDCKARAAAKGHSFAFIYLRKP